MIRPLLRFSLRRLLSRVLTAAVCGVAGAMAALLLYNEPALEAITQMRSQAEPLFKALGVGACLAVAALGQHCAGVLLAVGVPAVCGIRSSAVDGWLGGIGEMAHFGGSQVPQRHCMHTSSSVAAGRGSSGSNTFCCRSVGWYPCCTGLLSVTGVAAAFTGLLAMTAGAALFALMISANRDTALSAQRRAHAWIGLAFVLWMLSRADNMLRTCPM